MHRRPLLEHNASGRRARPNWSDREAVHPALRCATIEDMGKRIMLVVVGAGMGSLAGLLAAFLGAGNIALFVGAVVGGILPLLVLGAPGR